MMDLDKTSPRSGRQKKNFIPEVAKVYHGPGPSPSAAGLYSSSAGAGFVRAVKSPPGTIFNNNNNPPPGGLVFAVKSRPQPVSPDMAPPDPAKVVKNSVVAEKVADAVRRTYEGKGGHHVLKFDLGQGQVGVAAVGQGVEKGMPLLSQTTDVPLAARTDQQSVSMAMPELTAAVGQNVQTMATTMVSKSKPPAGGPMRPKPRFYINKDVAEDLIVATTNVVEKKVEPPMPKIKVEKGTNSTPATAATPAGGDMVGHRSVRNKRKKEVFDPSDLFTPKQKKVAFGLGGVTIKQEQLEEQQQNNYNLPVAPVPRPTTTYVNVNAANNASNNNNNNTNATAKSAATPTTSTPQTKRGRPPKSATPKPRAKPKSVSPKKETKVGDKPMPSKICKVCNRWRNVRGSYEKFAVCSECYTCYHPSCLKLPKDLVCSGRHSTWKCSECKSCTVCTEILDSALTSVECSRCTEGSHLKCLNLSAKPSRWECDSCANTDYSGTEETMAETSIVETPSPEVEIKAKVEVKAKKVQPSTPTGNKRSPKSRRNAVKSRYMEKMEMEIDNQTESAKDEEAVPVPIPQKLQPSSSSLCNNREPSLLLSKIEMPKLVAENLQETESIAVTTAAPPTIVEAASPDEPISNKLEPEPETALTTVTPTPTTVTAPNSDPQPQSAKPKLILANSPPPEIIPKKIEQPLSSKKPEQEETVNKIPAPALEPNVPTYSKNSPKLNKVLIEKIEKPTEIVPSQSSSSFPQPQKTEPIVGVGNAAILETLLDKSKYREYRQPYRPESSTNSTSEVRFTTPAPAPAQIPMFPLQQVAGISENSTPFQPQPQHVPMANAQAHAHAPGPQYSSELQSQSQFFANALRAPAPHLHLAPESPPQFGTHQSMPFAMPGTSASATSGSFTLPAEFPDNPSIWTPQDVEIYLRSHGLRDEGAVFRDQEIDGMSLMLMRRSDIIQGMHLKLGPALKVHRLVAELQASARYRAAVD